MQFVVALDPNDPDHIDVGQKSFSQTTESILLAVITIIANEVLVWVVEILVDWERHHSESGFQRSVARKVFIGQVAQSLGFAGVVLWKIGACGWACEQASLEERLVVYLLMDLALGPLLSMTMQIFATRCRFKWKGANAITEYDFVVASEWPEFEAGVWDAEMARIVWWGTAFSPAVDS